ncbi:MAG: hypothetical protein E7375_01180 [Clostridiales bacterium]|nr:hypothetical protein [Clostridiales bacterium]
MENLAFIQLTEKKTKLLIVQSRNGRYRVLEEVENYYNLTNDIMKDCLFSPKSKADILKILNIYRYTIETFKVGKMIAIASNVIVKARNYRGFLDEIYTNTGMNFVISNDDEVVKNIYMSSMTKVDVSKGYIVNIGSYQTYILKFNRRNVVEYNIIPYGYSNLNGSFAEMVATVRKDIKKASLVKNFDGDILIGCGPSFIDISKIGKKLTRYPIDIDNNYELSASTVGKVVDFSKDLDLAKIKKIKGIGPEGAESLNGGLAIISALFELLQIENITVSTAEQLEGVVLSNLVGNANEKYSDMLQNSLDNYYEFKKEGLAINGNVYEMAILLFKQLKVVHKLPRTYVKALKVSAYMFDCGKFINFDNHQKHSFYAILNSNICGASQKDILLAAFACTCQNLDNFNLAEIMKYKEILTDEDIEAIRKLGIIVNLAVNLNASRKNVINDIVCDILGDSIIMKTIVNSDPSFEILQSMKISDDFKKIFKKSLQII